MSKDALFLGAASDCHKIFCRHLPACINKRSFFGEICALFIARFEIRPTWKPAVASPKNNPDDAMLAGQLSKNRFCETQKFCLDSDLSGNKSRQAKPLLRPRGRRPS